MLRKLTVCIMFFFAASSGLFAQQWYRLTLRNTAANADMTMFLEAADRNALLDKARNLAAQLWRGTDANRIAVTQESVTRINNPHPETVRQSPSAGHTRYDAYITNSREREVRQLVIDAPSYGSVANLATSYAGRSIWPANTAGTYVLHSEPRVEPLPPPGRRIDSPVFAESSGRWFTGRVQLNRWGSAENETLYFSIEAPDYNRVGDLLTPMLATLWGGEIRTSLIYQAQVQNIPIPSYPAAVLPPPGFTRFNVYILYNGNLEQMWVDLAPAQSQNAIDIGNYAMSLARTVFNISYNTRIEVVKVETWPPASDYLTEQAAEIEGRRAAEAERERQAEAERQAAEQAERERQAAAEAERQRQAEAETERLAEEEAERQRQAVLEKKNSLITSVYLVTVEIVYNKSKSERKIFEVRAMSNTKAMELGVAAAKKSVKALYQSIKAVSAVKKK